MMKEIFDGVTRLLLYLFVTGLYLVMLVADILLSGYLLWGPLVSGPGGAPGARDGTGLIFFFLLWFVATAVCTTILATVQGWILKALFPWWEPPDHDDLL